MDIWVARPGPAGRRETGLRVRPLAAVAVRLGGMSPPSLHPDVQKAEDVPPRRRRGRVDAASARAHGQAQRTCASCTSCPTASRSTGGTGAPEPLHCAGMSPAQCAAAQTLGRTVVELHAVMGLPMRSTRCWTREAAARCGAAVAFVMVGGGHDAICSWPSRCTPRRRPSIDTPRRSPNARSRASGRHRHRLHRLARCLASTSRHRAGTN